MKLALCRLQSTPQSIVPRLVLILVGLVATGPSLNAQQTISGNMSMTGNLDVQGGVIDLGAHGDDTSAPGLIWQYTEDANASYAATFSLNSTRSNSTLLWQKIYNEGYGAQTIKQMSLDPANVLKLYGSNGDHFGSGDGAGIVLDPSGISFFYGSVLMQGSVRITNQYFTGSDDVLTIATGDGRYLPRIPTNSTLAFGYNASASLPGSTALGNTAKATGPSSTAVGASASASGANSNAFGFQAKAIAIEATALGNYANATGNYAVALGYGSQALGSGALALGINAAASQQNALALGYTSSAQGFGSVTLGVGSLSSGVNAAALGAYSTATGDYSLALGNGSHATQSSASALGTSATASGYGSTGVYEPRSPHLVPPRRSAPPPGGPALLLLAAD